jgi:hypothetical protein
VNVAGSIRRTIAIEIKIGFFRGNELVVLFHCHANPVFILLKLKEGITSSVMNCAAMGGISMMEIY